MSLVPIIHILHVLIFYVIKSLVIHTSVTCINASTKRPYKILQISIVRLS